MDALLNDPVVRRDVASAPASDEGTDGDGT
jgi:hypothetical protein